MTAPTLGAMLARTIELKTRDGAVLLVGRWQDLGGEYVLHAAGDERARVTRRALDGTVLRPSRDPSRWLVTIDGQPLRTRRGYRITYVTPNAAMVSAERCLAVKLAEAAADARFHTEGSP